MAGRYTLTRSAYAVLGVDEGAGDEEIRKAYRRRARETHPDVGGDAAEFSEVQQAWELIGTAESRERYAREQRYASTAAGRASGYATASGPYATTVDFETFLRAAAAAAQQQRNAAGTTRPGYWEEFGPASTWNFNGTARQQPTRQPPVSWAAVIAPVLAFFLPVGGIVAGAIGLYQTRQGKRLGRSMARWGLVVSIVTTLIWVVPSVIKLFT